VMLLGSTGVTMQAEAADGDVAPVEINETNFPDEVFRKYISIYFDLDSDGILSADELEEITSIAIPYDTYESIALCYVEDFSGIEYFYNLQELAIGSRNSRGYEYRSAKPLDKLDVSKNTQLRELNCSGRGLQELDVSKNVNLTYLNCSDNDLIELDLSGLTKLETLYVGFNLGIRELDLSDCPNLREFYAQGTRLFIIEKNDTIDVASVVNWSNPAGIEYEDNGVFDANGTKLTGKYANSEIQLWGSSEEDGGSSISVYVVDDLSDIEKVKEIELEQTDVYVGWFDSLSGDIDYEPNGSYERIVKWKSSDSKVININNAGHAEALKVKKGDASSDEPGEVVITATSESGLTASTNVAVRFRDVDNVYDYFYHPVYWAFNNGITTGKSDGRNFAPSDTCTRAQIVTFLWRMAGKPDPGEISKEFEDVTDKTAYYYKAVYWAKNSGITSGRSGGTLFDPNGSCTRREIVTFLWRYAGKPTPSKTGKFTDVADSSAYYYKAVYWAVEQGITTGKAASNYTTFDPTGLCTRAMAVTFIYRYAYK